MRNALLGPISLRVRMAQIIENILLFSNNGSLDKNFKPKAEKMSH
jgi:hypothetical protein